MNINNCSLAGVIDSNIMIKYVNSQREVCDFVLKVRRYRKDKLIYDLIDCSIYGKRAVEFVENIQKGDCVFIFGEYRSQNMEIDGLKQFNEFSHFHVANFQKCSKK